MTNTATTATRGELVKVSRNHRLPTDRRKKCTYAVWAYWVGATEYRRAYMLPVRATDAEIRAAAPDTITVAKY